MIALRPLLLTALLILTASAPVMAQAPTPSDLVAAEWLSGLSGEKFRKVFDRIDTAPSPQFLECLCPTEYSFHYFVGPEGACRRIGPLGGPEFRGFDGSRMQSCAAAYPLPTGASPLAVVAEAARRLAPPPRPALTPAQRDAFIKAGLYGLFDEVDYDSKNPVSKFFSDHSTAIDRLWCLGKMAAGYAEGPAAFAKEVAGCLVDEALDHVLEKDYQDAIALFKRADYFVRALDDLYLSVSWDKVDAMSDADRRAWFLSEGALLAEHGTGLYDEREKERIGVLTKQGKYAEADSATQLQIGREADIMLKFSHRWGGRSKPDETFVSFSSTYADGWQAHSPLASDAITMPAYVLNRLWELHRKDAALH